MDAGGGLVVGGGLGACSVLDAVVIAGSRSCTIAMPASPGQVVCDMMRWPVMVAVVTVVPAG